MSTPVACVGRVLFALFILAGTGLVRAAAQPSSATLRTAGASFTVDGRGSLAAIARDGDGRNLLAPGQPAPLLSIRLEGKLFAPESATWLEAGRRLTLRYGVSGATATLAVEAKPSHVRFEVLEAQPADRIELVLWGPYPTTIGETIGEVIGVARDAECAVGIQALNVRTLGGYPGQEHDIEPDYTADDSGTYPELPAELKKDQLFRGDTARRTAFGSVLQAYCRNRNRERVIANWGHEKYVAPAFADGGVVGSAIALFAGPAGQALDTLGAIEVAEGLPHPLLDGVWVKQSPQANCSYLIVDFSEATIDQAVEMTKRAGLRYLYHSSPFETWGHFELKASLFPHGRDGLRACVEKARRAGVRVGFHTLSNFITPNDPYVTPKPDPRLARIGSSTLVGAVDATQREIPVVEVDCFRKATAMNAVVIGDELIAYGGVSSEAPWRLLECKRGAWGTAPAAHASGSVVGKLMDHDYKVFLTNADLTREVAQNIAKLCNEAGTLQISLDGLEGAWSTGMGQYGRALFCTSWYEGLAPELRGQINDASNPGHFNWHVYTRMNWGEPWYAGFRESQTLYRFKNQLHFERNLMPHMLGWFALRPDTTVEDAEWLLARAAGFDAGFTLAASVASTAQLAADPASAEASRQFGAAPAILETVRQWETARMARAFTADMKALLRDNAREFHLEPAAAGRWNLSEVHVQHFARDAAKPGAVEGTYQNPFGEQVANWILRSVGKQPITAARVELNGRVLVELKDGPLLPGWSLRYRGGPEASLCDEAQKERARVPVNADAARVGTGAQRVAVGSGVQGDASLRLELRTLGVAQLVGAAPASDVEAGAPLPRPSAEQLRWQRHEFIAFAHFGMNTFTDREWGDGREDPRQFNPTDFDARQWAAVLQDAGVKLLILTAKHHDGFCLWPSRYTEHCVKNSPWREGKGDVVREVVDALRERSIRVGLYLSPWDRNQPCYGDSPKYNEYFQNQLRELLGNYGPVDEVWFDGACGEGPNGKKQEYDWAGYYAVVRELQPKALIAICGPDIRWVGNESGVARENESSVVDRGGQPAWHPAECDVSIRPGWFYHAAEDAQVKSVASVADIYFKSVGRNSVLLLNIPPDRRGRIADADVARLREFGAFVRELEAVDFVADSVLTACSSGGGPGTERQVRDHDLDTGWSPGERRTTGQLELDLGHPRTFNVARLQEGIALGERVQGYRIDVLEGDQWRTITSGQVVGHKQLRRFPSVTARRVRLVIEKAAAPPVIAEFGLHFSSLAAAEDNGRESRKAP